MSGNYHGVADDTRPTEAKARDWSAAEAYTATQPVWRTKKAPAGEQHDLRNATWRRFPVRDQGHQSSCVANSAAKALGVEESNETGDFVVFSHKPIYHDRPGYPAEGMASIDALDYGSKKGTTTEVKVHSQAPLEEADMNSAYSYDDEDRAIADRYRAGGYVSLPLDIDAIAAAIETRRVSVSIHIFGTYAEWNKDAPTVDDPSLTWDAAAVRHCVSAIDYTLYNGKKHLVIEDSWGKFEGMKGQRLVSEDFLKLRLRYAGHLLPRPDAATPTPAVPKPSLPRDLAWGSSGDDVRAWQAYLQAKGFFPASAQPTGLWAAITAQATLKWQVSHGLNDFVGAPINAVRFGPKSRAALAAE